MPTPLQHLKSQLAEISDLTTAAYLLEWDQQTYMPVGAAAGRAEQLATLQKIIHEKSTRDEIGRLLADLQVELKDAPPDADDTRLVHVAAREYNRRRKIPAALVEEIARVTGRAYAQWVQARAEKNFELFRPTLEKIFSLRRQEAECFQPWQSVYDPLLDVYEPGMPTAQVRTVFAELKRELVPLVQTLTRRPAPEEAFLHQPFEEHKQWDFGLAVIRDFGYDFQHGRQDKAVHPFTSSVGPRDVRITTRIMPNFFTSALMSTLHECGHALYDQGHPAAFERTPLADCASLGIHESQSRLWENIIGRSLGFWQHYYPKLQAVFSTQLGQVPLEKFYRAINKVDRSLIRVEADEVTYNLHTLLRFELEVAVLEGQLAVKDLPAAWNAKIKEYLGLEVPDDSVGVLQDIHWSNGYIGYFPTYTLGNIASVQFFQKAVQDMPVIPADIENGRFDNLLAWLRENIHRHGRKFTSAELIERVTGGPLNAGPYIAYLKRKYEV